MDCSLYQHSMLHNCFERPSESRNNTLCYVVALSVSIENKMCHACTNTFSVLFFFFCNAVK